MSESRRLWIPGPAGRLEAALRTAASPRAAAVVAHPHPLHGGTLHNPVIFHVDRELARAGLTTLRFNFRGAGESEGVHDAGVGEIDDVAAAVSWLRGVAAGVPLLLVGYSFGSWCAMRHAVRDPAVAGVIGIGIPARLYRFDEIAALGRPLAVVQGSRDEFGSPEEVRQRLAAARPPGQLHVIPDSPHRLPGRAREVAAAVVEAARDMLAGAVGPGRPSRPPG